LESEGPDEHLGIDWRGRKSSQRWTEGCFGRFDPIAHQPEPSKRRTKKEGGQRKKLKKKPDRREKPPSISPTRQEVYESKAVQIERHGGVTGKS